MNTKNKYYLICITLIVFYFQGVLIEYFHVDTSSLELIKIGLFCFMALTFFSKKMMPGFWLIILYLLWNFFSMLNHDFTLSDWYLHSRFILNSYIFFNFVWHANLSEKQVYKVLKLVFVIFVFQIVASGFELFVLNEQAEYRVGTMFYGGGGYATVFPLVAMSYGLGVFYFYKRNWKSFLLTFSFILIGYASGKRAVFFLVPFLFVIGEIVYLHLIKSHRRILKNLLFVSVIAVPCAMILLSLLGHTKKFTMLNEIPTFGSKTEYIYEVVNEYNFRDKGHAGRFGRGANNVYMYTLLANGAYNDFWFGCGPRSANKDKGWVAYKKYGIGYGASGWLFDLVSTGAPTVLLVILFFLNPLFLQFKFCRFSQLNSLGKALYFGNILFFISFFIIYFGYSNAFSATSMYTIIYFFMITLLVAPSYKRIFLMSLKHKEKLYGS